MHNSYSYPLLSNGQLVYIDIADHKNLIRPLLVGNVFLVTRPHVVEKAALFGHYCHYYALRMLSTITTVYPSILSLHEQEIVKFVQEMLR